MSNNQLLCVQADLSITRLIEYMKFFSCLLMTYALSSTSSDKIVKHSNIINDIDINNQDLEGNLCNKGLDATKRLGLSNAYITYYFPIHRTLLAALNRGLCNLLRVYQVPNSD